MYTSLSNVLFAGVRLLQFVIYALTSMCDHINGYAKSTET